MQAATPCLPRHDTPPHPPPTTGAVLPAGDNNTPPNRHTTAAPCVGVGALLAFPPMTARTRSSLGPSDGRRRGAQPDDKKPGREPGNGTANNPDKSHPTRLGFAASPLRLWLALLLSLAGAVL